MNQYKTHFHKIDPEKTAVCFTFDDNFSRHRDMIAPAFFERGWRCTFYVNPGTDDIAPHLENYMALLEQGFEISSHGDVHDNLTKLTHAAALENMQKAALRIKARFGVYPSTFAFPYHDYNDETLRMAKSLHFETRNTLADSIWIPIKTALPFSEMVAAVEQSITKKRPLVFSGHSVILTREEANNKSLKHEIGSNPILLDDLCALLDYIKARSHHVQVLTFEQAALLTFIRQHGKITKDSLTISQEHLDRLEAFGMGPERFNELI